jgi:hypothetical protein
MPEATSFPPPLETAIRVGRRGAGVRRPIRREIFAKAAGLCTTDN